MKFLTFVAALVAAIPAVVSLTINTPASVVECEPTLLTWSNGQEPYYLTFVPVNNPQGNLIKSFPTQTGTSYTWNVDLPSGSMFVIALKDSTGTQAYSSNVTVQSGSSTSCVNTSVQETGTGSASPASTDSSASTPTAGSTSSPAGTSVGSSSSPTSTPSGSSASASPSASATGTSTGTSGAGRLGVSTAFGVAGIMGLVGAMLF